MRVPNFFVIGAAKSGTTTLYEMLRRHPEAFVPIVKEPQFFSNDDHFAGGLERYLRTHFGPAPARARAVGECTPHYIVFEKAARRIRELLPPESHRFVLILRDPVERAYSLYWNMVAEGVETLSFEEALAAEADRIRDPELERLGSLRFSYFTSGCYGSQLEGWLRHFDRSRFLILRFEELRSEPRLTFQRLAGFLGLPSEGPVTETSVSNPSGMPRFPRLHRFLREPHPVKEPFKAMLPHAVKHRILNLAFAWNRKPRRYEPMRPETAAALRRRFAADVEQLSRLSGEDFRAWLPDAPAG